MQAEHANAVEGLQEQVSQARREACHAGDLLETAKGSNAELSEQLSRARTEVEDAKTGLYEPLPLHHLLTHLVYGYQGHPYCL